MSDADGFRRFQAFLGELAAAGEQAADEGLSLEQTLATVRLTKNEGIEEFVVIPGVMTFDRDFVVRRAWEEATGAVTAVPHNDEH